MGGSNSARAGCLLVVTQSRVSIPASATLAGNGYYGLAPVGHLHFGKVGSFDLCEIFLGVSGVPLTKVYDIRPKYFRKSSRRTYRLTLVNAPQFSAWRVNQVLEMERLFCLTFEDNRQSLDLRLRCRIAVAWIPLYQQLGEMREA